MSLAKQILKNKSNNNSKCDEFGIPLKDVDGLEVKLRPQYLVARALFMEQRDPEYNHNTIHRLHLRDGLLYNYNKEVMEDRKTFYNLTGVEYQVPTAVQIKFWAELKKRVPKLVTNLYKVCDGVWWDKKNGEIIYDNSND